MSTTTEQRVEALERELERRASGVDIGAVRKRAADAKARAEAAEAALPSLQEESRLAYERATALKRVADAAQSRAWSTENAVKAAGTEWREARRELTEAQAALQAAERELKTFRDAMAARGDEDE